MTLIVSGVNHRSAPVALLERLTVSEERLPKTLAHLASLDQVAEGALLSTCNRTEVYAIVGRFHSGSRVLRDFFCDICDVSPEDIGDHLYTFEGEGAAGHLFTVASGLDSMAVGEGEILGQVRRAFVAAQEHGSARASISALFRRGIEVGRRVRTETAIGRRPVSIAAAAVEVAGSLLDGLEGRGCLVLGSGDVGKRAGQALARAGARTAVMSRTLQSSQALAAELGVRSAPIDSAEEELIQADVVIACLRTQTPVVSEALLRRVVSARNARTLVVVDLAVPRNVEPRAGALEGIVLKDIDDLRGAAGRLAAGGELERAKRILEDEVHRFREWERTGEVAPTVQALQSKADQILANEMERIKGHLKAVDPQVRKAVEFAMRRSMRKLLHPAIENLKRASQDGRGSYAALVLNDLFGLATGEDSITES